MSLAPATPGAPWQVPRKRKLSDPKTAAAVKAKPSPATPQSSSVAAASSSTSSPVVVAEVTEKLHRKALTLQLEEGPA